MAEPVVMGVFKSKKTPLYIYIKVGIKSDITRLYEDAIVSADAADYEFFKKLIGKPLPTETEEEVAVAPKAKK